MMVVQLLTDSVAVTTNRDGLQSYMPSLTERIRRVIFPGKSSEGVRKFLVARTKNLTQVWSRIFLCFEFGRSEVQTESFRQCHVNLKKYFN